VTAGRDLVVRVFDALADRFATRAADIAIFTETGTSFEEGAVWEGVAALHGHESPGADHGPGWTVRPHPPYAEAGVTGSRDVADLLVFEPGLGGRVLIELSIIQDWSRNSWIDKLDGEIKHVHGREGETGQRTRHEIGYHAIRVGDNPGEHSIVFGMMGERIELTVAASNRDCYASGALQAAKWLKGKPNGLYNMFDVLGLE